MIVATVGQPEAAAIVADPDAVVSLGAVSPEDEEVITVSPNIIKKSPNPKKATLPLLAKNLPEGLFAKSFLVPEMWLDRLSKELMAPFAAFPACSAKYFTIRFTLHARALKHTDSFTRTPPRTRKNPIPCPRFSSEFVASIPALWA